MSPSTTAVDLDTPRRCSRCGVTKPLRDYPKKRRGNRTGLERTAKCKQCTPGSVDSDKENEPPAQPQVLAQRASASEAPVIKSPEEFYTLLNASNGVFNEEHAVDIGGVCTSLGTTDRKTVADSIAEKIWERVSYRYTYCTARKWKSQDTDTITYNYACAQNSQRMRESKKCDDETKHRDKEMMQGFKCDGWLWITLTEGESVAKVKVQHCLDHVHYPKIDLPPDVMQIIENGLDKTPSQLWEEILKVHPQPQFLRQTVQQAWAQRDRMRWQRDENELLSAQKLLEEGKKSGGLGLYIAEPITIAPEKGYTTLAWALPDVLRKWGGRIREVAMDSTWKTNGRNYELYAILGEAYGSGLPLGYLLLQHDGSGAEGATQRILEDFIEHFVQRWSLEVDTSHSDKHPSEINACRCKLNKAKHQLCFWHALRAVKTRLAILRRQPAHYNVEEACKEFSWIDKAFLPARQMPANAKAPAAPAEERLPQISVRLNGKLVPVPLPRSCRDPDNDAAAADSDEEDDEAKPDDSLDALVEAAIAEEDDDDAPEDDDASDQLDAPDWMLEGDEPASKDKAYVFCPAVHRKQLLRIFTKHFCQHPLLPEQSGAHTAAEIRLRAVYEMYCFCKQRGLREVWAYMWTSWYSPKMWPLWALSASPRIPRLRTTMVVENFWRQLKHEDLHHLLRPRLDQLVYILQTKVLPKYMSRAAMLDEDFRFGRAKPLTSSQKAFKGSWKRLAKLPLSKREYTTNTRTWQCSCGAQKYSAHLLCKHLVQAVPEPPISFWRQVYRRRTIPFYRHPALGNDSVLEGAEPESISAGDDHLWTGDKTVLGEDGLWRTIFANTDAQPSKRPRLEAGASSTSSAPPEGVLADGLDDEEAEEYHKLEQEVLERAQAMEEAARIMREQVGLRSRLWVRAIGRSDVGVDAVQLMADIRHNTSSGRVRQTTWAREGSAAERRYVRNTMGYTTKS